MKPASPNKPPLVHETSLGSEGSAASWPSLSSRDASPSVDSQEDTPPKSSANASSGVASLSLRLPTARGAFPRTVSGAHAEIARALSAGNTPRLEAVLEGLADNPRLRSVLHARSAQAAPLYARVLDHLQAQGPEEAAYARTVGAALLQAALEHDDLPRFQAACELFGDGLPALVAQDAARVFRTAALRPLAMTTLLAGLPSQHLDGMLRANQGEGLVYLWNRALRARAAGSHDARQALLRVFTQAEGTTLVELHRGNMQLQGRAARAARAMPEFLHALAQRLEARHIEVPWNDPA